MVNVRAAQAADEAALAGIDAITWTSEVSPAPARLGDDFFARNDPANVLVAELDGQVVGYATVRQGVPVPSHAHVLEINGLAVTPEHQGQGIGRALVEACLTRATEQGARKLTLRVLGTNARALHLYESCGFTIEGTLRDEFLLDTHYVDDIFMAHTLARDLR